jgi:TonB-dependent receptor
VVCERVARGGNPYLSALTSDNYDLSIENYFSRTGFASLSLFWRDVAGFVTPASFYAPQPDELTGLPLRIFGPINSGKGRLKGFEAQVSTFFDFAGVPDFARNFGVQANVTYIDASAKYPNFQDADDMIDRPLLDVSRWAYNLVGMYERGPLTARLAYNWRSRFLPFNEFSPSYDERRDFSSGDQPYVIQRSIRSQDRLDLSVSYAFNDNLTLFGDWTNILNSPTKFDVLRIDQTGPRFNPEGPRLSFPLAYRFEERVLSAGVRFRFGAPSREVPTFIAPATPAPAPVVQSAPVVEQPAPAAPAGERG